MFKINKLIFYDYFIFENNKKNIFLIEHTERFKIVIIYCKLTFQIDSNSSYHYVYLYQIPT